MLNCSGCGESRSCRNNLLQHIVVAHDADMSLWPGVDHA